MVTEKVLVFIKQDREKNSDHKVQYVKKKKEKPEGKNIKSKRNNQIFPQKLQ